MFKAHWAWVVIVVAATPALVFGNVYASGMELVAPNTVQYTLNETANAGLTMQVWEVGGGMVYSEDRGASLTRGTQSWTWNGTGQEAGKQYTIKVVASSSGDGSWTKIRGNGGWNNFFLPTGVEVNRNPNSENFGRVYVTNSKYGTTASGSGQDQGIYILKGSGDNIYAARTGGASFSSNFSPYRVGIGPNNEVFVADWSDARSQMLVGDANFSTAFSVLNDANRNSSGLAANHGSISTVHVEGSGSLLSIYTMDEDYAVTPGTSTGGQGSILRYDIDINSILAGNVHTAKPAVVYDDGAHGAFKGLIQNGENDIARGLDGTWWITQDRSGSSTDPLASLIQISADGSEVLWSSVTDLGANSLADPLRRTQGVAVDPVTGLLALATYRANFVHIFDPVSKTIVTSFKSGSDAQNTDVAWDAAGNLYITDSFNSRLHIYSPGGESTFVTESWFMVPEPASMLFLGVGAVLILRRRGH